MRTLTDGELDILREQNEDCRDEPLSPMDALAAMERDLDDYWQAVTDAADDARDEATWRWQRLHAEYQDATAEVAADMEYDAWADETWADE